MTANDLRQRHGSAPTAMPAATPAHAQTRPQTTAHPGGEIKHGTAQQALRMLLFGLYFSSSILAIALTQLVGAPLYWYSKDLFYAWMAMTKQHFGIVSTSMTYWWAPVKMRVSGDESVRGQFRKTADGRLECDFPERMVLISNHQIYTDWVYLWWIAYTSSMHGHLYIILKESIKYIPLLGTGMMFYGFIFLSRKWATDKERFRYRLKKLSSSHSGSLSGTSGLDPMWLLIFPEGTNLSDNGRVASKNWADKNKMPDLRHTLLPRSTGLHFSLQELHGTVEYLYDCTLAYEGVPVGQYGQDLFTLRSTYFQGRAPKSVNMYWRRFRIADMPLDDEEAFSRWVLARWREKDDLLQYYVEHNRFPADEGGVSLSGDGKQVQGAGWIETEVRPVKSAEWVQVYIPIAAVGLVMNVFFRMLHMVLRMLRMRS
ncbi:hypothetical protein ACEQ8H_003028 [Pleosporales sp. CAS-2024a]